MHDYMTSGSVQHISHWKICFAVYMCVKVHIHGATFVVQLCCATKVEICLELFHKQLLSSDKWQKAVSLFSYVLLVRQSIHPLRKIDNNSVVGAFGAILAVLVLCESAGGEEIVANGPGNGLGVDQGFEFINSWYRNCVSAMKQGTAICTYGCGHFR